MTDEFEDPILDDDDYVGPYEKLAIGFLDGIIIVSSTLLVLGLLGVI